MQTKRHSALETCASTAIGYSVAFVANMLVLPLFGFSPSLAQNFWISGIFTALSLVRGYAVRRLFNHLHTRGIL